jgi:biotin-dependent carboxylase-like uncharacterized protein
MIRLTRVGPLCTIQDEGRFGQLSHGVTASGPMDVFAYRAAGAVLGAAGAAIEFTTAGLALEMDAPVRIGFAGGDFRLTVNGKARSWPGKAALKAGDRVEVTPGKAGNYGYLRFDREIDVPLVMGSRSTNLVVRLGGFEGRALKAGDRLGFGGTPGEVAPPPQRADEGPIRFVWGIHADLFRPAVRQRFVEEVFVVSAKIDRMGARLTDRAAVFAGMQNLSLVSDAIVCGDVQILGDGTPIVLLRDHQPTGGYPRIATVISADIDRFAQMRPGSEVRFQPVTVARAQGLLR